jgi:dihydropteroate synthase
LPAFKEAEEDRPRPRIIHLSNLAVTSPFLTGWLDALEHNPQPVILCVGLPELPQPKAENAQVARRIGLLAIEQNAWLLAAQDPRCVVVATHEVARITPVIEALAQKVSAAISVDTRKSAVADAAFQSGARLVNDVSGFTFDPDLLTGCGENMRPVCVMHSQGLPGMMQNNPQYDDVVLDVFDFLQAQIAKLVAAGVSERCILADIGIGFGKTLSHNLALLNRISLFHGLGVPLLLGVSRKGFIGQIAGVEDPQQRLAGSLSVALAARAQGVQVFRVHEVRQTREAFDLDKAVEKGEADGA